MHLRQEKEASTETAGWGDGGGREGRSEQREPQCEAPGRESSAGLRSREEVSGLHQASEDETEGAGPDPRGLVGGP